MQKRRARKPWHEGSVFDRVPRPEAAPTKLIICPPGAERDTDSQKHPRGERPRAHRFRPIRVDALLQKPCDRIGEGDREPDIAEIKKRRMDRETWVLKERIEIQSVGRRGERSGERI